VAHSASGVRPVWARSAASPSQLAPIVFSWLLSASSTWVSSSVRLRQYCVCGSDAADPGPLLIMS
jgi:hypothetical protein